MSEQRARFPVHSAVKVCLAVGFTLAAMVCSLGLSSAAGTSRDGYEYVIIIPEDAAFAAWADSLKNWRALEGISTGVFDTGEIGSTWQEIRDFLANAYWSWTVPPTAVLLLGDHPGPGAQIGIPSPPFENMFVADNVYADVDGDGLPDFVIARITARNEPELAHMIGKQFAHERSPSPDPQFYGHPVFASGWEPDGHSVMQTETYAGFLANVLGQDPVREYTATTPGTVWPDPEWLAVFGPSGLGYLPATPEYLTDWGGNAARINADINAGAYLVVHRGMGQVTGWGDPPYTVPDVAGLANTAYPFVFSLEALAGKFDYGADCLTEALHRSPYGAVGVISATDLTYSAAMRQLCLYLFDCLWPDFLPGTGASEPELRPAFALAQAKHCLAGDALPLNPQHKQLTYHVLHYHGEPFAVMHDRLPAPLAVVHDGYCVIGAATFTVQADAGARIGLTIDGEIVGTAFGTGAPQAIVIEPPAATGTLRVVVTKANHLRYDASVPIRDAAATQPDPGARDRLSLRVSNPVRADQTAEVRFSIPPAQRASGASLQVLDAGGRVVRCLLDGPLPAGERTAVWDGRDETGARAPRGVYFVRLRLGSARVTRSVVRVD